MGWVLRLVETGVEGPGGSVDVLEIVRRGDFGDIAALGLTLSEGRRLLALVQQEIVASQCRDHATRRPTCRSCAAACQVKDYRPRRIATLFGQVTLRLPGFRCADCGGTIERLGVRCWAGYDRPSFWLAGDQGLTLTHILLDRLKL